MNSENAKFPEKIVGNGPGDARDIPAGVPIRARSSTAGRVAQVSPVQLPVCHTIAFCYAATSQQVPPGVCCTFAAINCHVRYYIRLGWGSQQEWIAGKNRDSRMGRGITALRDPRLGGTTLPAADWCQDFTALRGGTAIGVGGNLLRRLLQLIVNLCLYDLAERGSMPLLQGERIAIHALGCGTVAPMPPAGRFFAAKIASDAGSQTQPSSLDVSVPKSSFGAAEPWSAAAMLPLSIAEPCSVYDDVHVGSTHVSCLRQLPFAPHSTRAHRDMRGASSV